MEELLSPRQHKIIIAIISEFIASAEPVGSTTLVRKYDILVSSATIRNEMSRLENKGFLFQPHTSSGRIPTDRAYRYYVDFLMQKSLNLPHNLDTFLEEYKRLEAHLHKLIGYTGKLLSDLTQYTSLVLVPRFKKDLFRFLKITPLEGRRILLILMTNTGSIKNKVIHLSRDISEEHFKKMTRILNERLSGMFLRDINPQFLQKLPEEINEDLIHHLSQLTKESVISQDSDVICEGTRHLLELPEFQDLNRLRSIFNMLENEKLVSEILNKTLATEGLKVYIGSEHNLEEMKECSFITATYGLGGIPLGAIAILGPTRMPYGRIIPVVNSLAKLFSEKLTRLAEF